MEADLKFLAREECWWSARGISIGSGSTQSVVSLVWKRNTFEVRSLTNRYDCRMWEGVQTQKADAASCRLMNNRSMNFNTNRCRTSGRWATVL